MKGFLNRVSGGGDKDANKGAVEDKPADATAARTTSRRKSAFASTVKVPVVKELPLLQETPMLKREALFRQKLQLCNVIFDFEDPDIDVAGKEQKRETLVELAEYINSPVGQKILTESMMPDIVETVRVNLFRALPPQTADYDPEEDEPAMELTWPHMQVVYELFLRFIVSTEVSGKVTKKFVDQTFLI